MKKVLVLVLILMALGLLVCDSPTDPKSNPYEQQPIEWPSLADSPWPMYQGSPLCNGLSFQSGPQKLIAWREIDAEKMGNGIAVDDSGNAYFSSEMGSLYKIGIDGKIKWQKRLINGYIDEPGTPMLLKNDELFVHLGQKAFLVNKSGVVVRILKLPSVVWLPSFQIDMNGDLYAVTDMGCFFKMTQEGAVVWSILPPDSLDDAFSWSIDMPVFLPNGESLILVALNHIYCINTDGNIIWFRKFRSSTSPFVSANGLVFAYNVRDSTLNCFNSVGKWEWQKKVPGYVEIELLSRGAITPEGDLVFPILEPACGVIKFSRSGDIIWMLSFEGGLNVCSELVVDYSGRIYISNSLGSFYIISPDGEIISKFGERIIVGLSPAIYNNILYFGDQYGRKLYVVE